MVIFCRGREREGAIIQKKKEMEGARIQKSKKGTYRLITIHQSDMATATEPYAYAIAACNAA